MADDTLTVEPEAFTLKLRPVYPDPIVFPNCDVCGKSIVEPDGTEFVGISIILSGNFSEEFIKQQLGPYAANRQYKVCFECLLRNLGVKPDTEEVPDA